MNVHQRDLHFVSVTNGKGTGWDFPHEQRRVRAFVMKDYLKHKNNPQMKLLVDRATQPMSAYVGRFRSSSRKRSKGASTRLRNGEKVKRVINKKPIRPRESQISQVEILSDGVPRRSLYNIDRINQWSTLPVDVSEPEDLSLLEYYYHSFWENSYACNPEGQWMAVALSDTVIIHAMFTLIALHQRHRDRDSRASTYFKYRGQTLRLISQRLANHTVPLDDATVAAVAILSSSEHQSDWDTSVQVSHINGLATLVKLRGGIDSLSTNRHIGRVVDWANLLSAAVQDVSPAMERSKEMVRARGRQVDEVVSHWKGLEQPADFLDDLPHSVRDIFQQLRVLQQMKLVLLSNRTKSLNHVFSDMLSDSEHDILALKATKDKGGMSTTGDRLLFWNKHMLSAIKTAMQIFSFDVLRNLSSPAVFGKFVSRIQTNVSSFFAQKGLLLADGYPSAEFSGIRWQIQGQHASNVSILLWILFLGWKAARLSREDPRWFTKVAADLCTSCDLDPETLLVDEVQQGIFPDQDTEDLYLFCFDVHVI